MKQMQIKARILKTDIEILGECRGRCNLFTFKNYAERTLVFLGFHGSLSTDGMYRGLLLFDVVGESQSESINFGELFERVEY